VNNQPRKVIGYLRVSAINQDLEKNKADNLVKYSKGIKVK